MKKFVIATIATMVLGSIAHASVASTTGGVDTPLGSATPTNVSNTSAIYKAAVVAAQNEAVYVLATDATEVSAVFVQGAQAAQELTGTAFTTNREAAIAILSIANQY